MFAACARLAAALALGAFALLGVGVDARAQPAPDYAALIAAPDRSDNDRQADKRRLDALALMTRNDDHRPRARGKRFLDSDANERSAANFGQQFVGPAHAARTTGGQY